MTENKFVLGTANFSNPYGLTRRHTPNISDLGDILDYCREVGINELDTAIGYGDAHKILGTLGCSDFSICTKLTGMPSTESSAFHWLERQLTAAFEDLGVSRVTTLLLHSSHDVLGPRCDELLEGLNMATKIFDIEKIGVSVYYPDELASVSERMRLDVAQVPCNLIDRRFVHNERTDFCIDEETTLYGRSIFLQGLLLMKGDERPKYFNPWGALLDQVSNSSRRQNTSPLHLCLKYIKNVPKITKWVIGVESKQQLQEIVSASRELEASNISIEIPDLCEAPVELVVPTNWRID